MMNISDIGMILSFAVANIFGFLPIIVMFIYVVRKKPDFMILKVIKRFVIVQFAIVIASVLNSVLLGVLISTRSSGDTMYSYNGLGTLPQIISNSILTPISMIVLVIFVISISRVKEGVDVDVCD